MKSESDQLAESGAERVVQFTATKKRWQVSRCGSCHGTLVASAALGISLLCSAVAAAQGNSPPQLRRLIDQQVGGIQKLMVPAHDADLPQPRLTNGRPDPFFQTTETKRYLGKQLFHDPIRTARILPEFGGVLATRQTASCGSCHDVRLDFIRPGRPVEKTVIEIFTGRLRDECLSAHVVSTIEAQCVLDAWRHDYNHVRPHSALHDRTPAAMGTLWVARKDRIETEIAVTPTQQTFARRFGSTFFHEFLFSI